MGARWGRREVRGGGGGGGCGDDGDDDEVCDAASASDVVLHLRSGGDGNEENASAFCCNLRWRYSLWTMGLMMMMMVLGGRMGRKGAADLSHENMKLDFTSSYSFLYSSRASLVHNMNT